MSNRQPVSTEGINASLRNPQGKDIFTRLYHAYIADRLPGTASPQTFHAEVDRVVREIIDGKSTDPTKPVPPIVRDHVRQGGSFWLDDIVGLAKEHCPPEFAQEVYAAHRQHYG